MGVLENSPHNQVHNLVGGPTGLMTDPDKAAADPIFWLHHANIDRIWNQWISEGHQNPTDNGWLSQSFTFYDADGSQKSLKCSDVLDIVAQLDYEYVAPAVLAPPRPPRFAAAMADGSGARKAELVGGSEAPVTLTGAPVTVPVQIDQRASREALQAIGSDKPERVYLTVQEIEGDTDPGTVYGIYLNLPPESTPEVAADHYAGSVSFFGIAKAAAPRADEPPHSVSVSHDITELTTRLQEQGQWDGVHAMVTFRPTGLVPVDQPELAHAVPPDLSNDDPPIKIGRVSIFYR
jgi:tyrosinase